MPLRAAVYVAQARPFRNPKNPGAKWSPISSTLILGDSHAILVDAPVTVAQTEDLADWIERLTPTRELSLVYITHGHADHFLGLPVLRKQFPRFKAIASAGTTEHMKAEISPRYYQRYWGALFPELAEPLPKSGEFEVEGHAFKAIEVGHSDTYNSTGLWVPSIKLAACGDVVYGDMHQMLAVANTPELQTEWIAAIEKIEALQPEMVVAGHKKPGETDGTYHPAATKQYIRDFGRLSKWCKNADELMNRMLEIYPDRGNPAALSFGAISCLRKHAIKL